MMGEDGTKWACRLKGCGEEEVQQANSCQFSLL